ncbi:MAG: PQQ-binding-like beta-propeller repeat protein [Candidatus Hydrothermia bacterium]
MELLSLIERIEDLKEKYSSVTRALSKLNEFYEKGEITEKQFKILKNDYEKEINFLSRELETLLHGVQEEVERLSNELKELDIEYNKTKIGILLGDIPSDQGKSKLTSIAKQMAMVQHNYNQFKALLEADTEEDFQKVKGMTPPTTIKVENVTPISTLLQQEEELRARRLQGKGQTYLKQLEELYNRLEKIKDFITDSMKEVETQKNLYEEEAGKLVIKIRMGGPEEPEARNRLMEVIKKVKEYDELLAKMSKAVEEINSKLGLKESVLIGLKEEPSNIGHIEEINLEEAAKILENLEKQGLEVISTETPIEVAEEEVEEEKEKLIPTTPEIRVVKKKKKSPVPVIVVSLIVLLGALFAVYRKFFFTATTKSEVVYPSYMGNESHNFNAPCALSKTPPRIAWSRNLDGTPAQPAIDSGILYIGTSSGKLYALDTGGNILWTTQLEGAILHSPAIYENNIIVGTQEGYVYILNKAGQIIRNKKIDGAIVSPPVAFGEFIYIPTFQDGLYAYNINKDQIEWKFVTTGMLKNTPGIYEDHVYIADLTGKIYVIDAKSGVEIGGTKTSAPIEAFLTYWNGKIYYGNNGGEIGAFDINKNFLSWSFNLQEPIVGALSIKDTFTVVATAFGKIFTHNSHSGLRIWNFDTGNLIFSVPVIVDSFVLVSSTTPAGDFGELYCLNLTNGNLLWVLPVPRVLENSPVFWNNYIFLAGRDGTIFSMSF